MSKNDVPKDEETKDKAEKKKLKLPLGLIIGFFMCFLISVGASSGISFFLSSSSVTESVTGEQSVEETLKALESQIAQQQQTISKLEQESSVLKTYLRHSSSTALKNILINQEENIQAYLAVMRQGIGDLSDLVPRGTDWANEYQYRTDLALKSSLERLNLLRLLKTGEPPSQSSTDEANQDSTEQ
ncbi:hypothetical protein [Marinomonas balearica]|uniref:Uncharacterized protein n=1 Tax=Marinomonas balearica TaxID=491947 RepID=A0A4R6MCJ3_9GAMM|nr:hypothetical protein [Marinomonas balearica]TDO99371.1 hypothetical protein DFP79_0352 [Marinomonas balearica]